MISLKSKKKSMKFKGGSIDDPKQKKLIFDALFDLYDAIINDTHFTQFSDSKEITIINNTLTIDQDIKNTYLYFAFKYFFGLLFENIIPSDIDNQDLLKKMDKYIFIINQYYNRINSQYIEKTTIPVEVINPATGFSIQQMQEVNELKDKEISCLKNSHRIFFDFKQKLEFTYGGEDEKKIIFNLYSHFRIAIKHILTEQASIYINDNKAYIYSRLLTDLFSDKINNKNLFTYDETQIYSLITIIYNFIIENYTFDKFTEVINSLNFNFMTNDNEFYDLNNMGKMPTFIKIFINNFNNTFKAKIGEKYKNNELEEKLIRSFSNPSITPPSQKEKDYLRKKALYYQTIVFDLIDNNDLNEKLILNALEYVKYFNSLNEFENSINIIKKLLELNFQLKDNLELNKLNLILALLYYYYANKNYENVDNLDIDDFYNKYITNIILAIYYFNIYFSSIETKTSSLNNQEITAIISIITKDYNDKELNILVIYNELIRNISKYKYFENSELTNLDDNKKRKLLQILLLAYTYYKQLMSININKDNGSDKYIIYPLKDNGNKDKDNDKKLSKLLEKENTDELLKLLIKLLENFKTTELLRLFFFRTHTEPNDFFIDKMRELDITSTYNTYLTTDETSKTKLIDNVYDEILKFDKDKKLPHALDVLLSIHKYSYLIPKIPSEDIPKPEYNSYILEVFNPENKDKDKDKEQYEFFKTLLNVFYMNISILYYNLFLGNPKLFQTLKDNLKDKKISNDFIDKDELFNMEFKEENKGNIIFIFMKHLRILFQSQTEITYDNIQFLLILFNNLYTSNEDDLIKFITAMYNKLFNIEIKRLPPIYPNRIEPDVSLLSAESSAQLQGD
jgi:hypothetical protein